MLHLQLEGQSHFLTPGVTASQEPRSKQTNRLVITFALVSPEQGMCVSF